MAREKSIAETEVVYDSDDSCIKTNLLQQYSGRCRWLKDQRFLRELEGDSVDTEILDEELRSIQDDEPKHCRGKTLKLLESNPFQIVLCVLVLVDAGVVIAEILLDLHAIRSQLTEAETSMSLAGNYLKAFYLNDFHGNSFEDLDEVLAKLQHSYSKNKTVIKLRIFEHCEEHFSTGHSPETYNTVNHSLLRRNTAINTNSSNESVEGSLSSQNAAKSTHFGQPDAGNNDAMQSQQPLPAKIPALTNTHHNKDRRDSPSDEDSNSPFSLGLKSSGAAGKAEMKSMLGETYDQSDGEPKVPYKSKPHKYTYAEKLLKIAHVLHYCSIGILGLFVLQVVVKMYGMGLEFFRQKMEVFDAVIISASFALDLVFLNGVGSAKGEEAAALLVVFLLWRLLRVINGLMVTAKKRQEFRIKLQKRARRKAEKRLETLEEEKRLKEEELKAIKELCKEKGASDLEVTRCRPRKNIFQKMDTSAGLSSIAALSLGFGMSMSTSRMAPSPALSRNVATTAKTQLKGKPGEIKLQNLMLRVGLVEETETKSPRQYLSVPKRKGKRTQSTSPRASPRASPNVSPSTEKHLFPCNNTSLDSNKQKLKKQDSLDELIMSDKNGNININQNNSCSDYSDAEESETEKAGLNFTEVVDLHITCSQKELVSESQAPQTTESLQPLLGSCQTESLVSSANRCYPPSSKAMGFQHQLTANISISDETVNRNGCQTKRVIFATNSHPHASKSCNIQRQLSLNGECDIDKTKALDSVDIVKDLSAHDSQKECVLNGRVNAEMSEEFGTAASPHVGVNFSL